MLFSWALDNNVKKMFRVSNETHIFLFFITFWDFYKTVEKLNFLFKSEILRALCFENEKVVKNRGLTTQKEEKDRKRRKN